MKKQAKLYSGIAIMAMALTMSTAPFFAGDVLATDAENKTTTGMHDKNKDMTGMHDNKAGSMQGGYSVLGSNFIGMEVQNTQGENVGEVEDIMIDSKGKVRYAAVSYGGFMGMGDTLYAVPLDAFTFKRDRDMFYDDVVLMLDVTEEQLKDDKGFNKENWPNLDDEFYRDELDNRYRVNRSGVFEQPAVKN